MNNFLKIKNGFKSLINSILGQYIISILIISITAFLCSPLANTNNYHVVSFILLFVVSFLSTFMGIRPVLLASTLSALAWNFFFIPPHLTFHIEKTEDILIFGLFFIIALLNGILTTRVRRQEKIAIEREKRTNALFQLTKELSKTSGIKEVVDVSQKEIRKNFDVNPIIIVQDGNEKLVLPESATLKLINFETAQWSFSNLEKAGANTEHFASTNFTYFPLFGSKIKSGIIAINNYNKISGDKISFWDTFVVQISNALEREFLIEMAQKVRFLDESDRLYKTLFNSISHELRIPVATIMGASDSIINSENSKEVQMALCNEIFTASLRLNRLIENLLNISRLESGYLSIRLDWHDINDLINKVLDELEEELKNFIININIPDEMPLIRIDFGIMEQVLYNLIYNSSQYAPPGSIIQINTSFINNKFIIEVFDNGPGFKETDLKNVFKKFFRADGSKTGGLGLGLSIVKGFVEAHNGNIIVKNNIDGGVKFALTIPSEIPEIKNL